MATIKLSDHTGSMWVTIASDAVGEEIFDMDVSTIKAKFTENDSDLFEQLELDRAYLSYYVRIMAKPNVY